jgi:hypothetical protein
MSNPNKVIPDKGLISIQHLADALRVNPYVLRNSLVSKGVPIVRLGASLKSKLVNIEDLAQK